jgi:GT2 family glycosyltransferase
VTSYPRADQPTVSVCMQVCNVERFLAESIESILGQTYRDFEFIIVDFGSTDNSKSIISGYAAKDDRIRFHEIPNCVLPVARNAGCALARGRYIAIMDADDVSLPSRLAVEVEFMGKHPEIGFLGAATEWIDATGKLLGIREFPSEDLEIKSALLSHCPMWHPTMFIRKEAFDLVGGYRAPFVFAHDYDLVLRLAEHFKCLNLRDVVLKYRIHLSQVTFRKQKQQTLCKLAAQVSAAARRERKPDPVDECREVTPAWLTEVGIGEKAQQNGLFADCRTRVRSLCAGGEISAGLDTALGMLGANVDNVERWQIADMHLTVSQLYWMQGRLTKSFLALVRAMLIRPALIAAPLRPLLTRLGLRRDRDSFPFPVSD